MNRALVTFAVGAHTELLDIARPSFQRFADRHGYQLVEPRLESDRPVSWWKIPMLHKVLDGFDEALWVDADIVIVDDTDDLDVPEGVWQALVEHYTADGTVPNCGVWMVRRPMRQWLERIWRDVRWLEHGWWEQAALMDALGYRVEPRPAFKFRSSILDEHTHWLDKGWNVHLWDVPGPDRPRFMHATMHPDRATVMREWAAGLVPEVPDTPCRHLYPVESCPYCLPVAA